MVTQLSVGIDYHQESLQVCVMEGDGRIRRNKRIVNDVKKLIETIGAEHEEVVITGHKTGDTKRGRES